MGLLVRDVMTREVFAVSQETSLGTTASLFVDRHITGAPVIDATGKPVGVVTQTDLVDPVRDRSPRRGTSLYYRIAGQTHPIKGRDAVSAEGVVEDVMSPLLFVTTPDTPVSEAVDVMVANDVHRLLVVEHGKLVGVVTSTDVMRTLRR
jgi:CBS domain-containing protein